MTRTLCLTCREHGEHQEGCLRISGSAVCQACAMTGHDGDSCRANLGCDNRISCVTCGRVMSQLPHSVASLPREIQELVFALVTAKDLKRKFLTVTHVDGSGAQFDHQRGANALAHDVDCLAIDNTRVVLSNGPFETLTLTFSSNDLEAYRKATARGRTPVATRKVPNHFPESLADAIEKLTAFGFSYCNDRHTSFKYGEGSHAGLRAEVSFIP